MTIGVYRIFLSETWRTSGVVEQLLAEFDANPQFLYRIDRVEDTVPASTSGEGIRADIRIAMTQSHVALILLGQPSTSQPRVAYEIDLARNAFRRRIPVIGIIPPRTTAPEVPNGLRLDRVLDWSADDIACAVQELAEEAAASLRRDVGEQMARLAPGVDRQLSALRKPVAPSDPVRSLPVAEVADALAQLRARREQSL